MNYTKLFDILSFNSPITLEEEITEKTELYEIYRSESEDDILKDIKRFYKVDLRKSPEYDNAETVKDLISILDKMIKDKMLR